METIPAPRPEEKRYDPNDRSNAELKPQDPWAETAAPASEHYQIPADHSGNLAPLPGMSPEEEAGRFDAIAHTLKGTEIVTRVHGLGETPHTENTSDVDTTEPYTPRHLRLNEEPFTPNPATETNRRNEASFKATVGLATSLKHTNPELIQGVNNYLQNTPLPPTEKPAGTDPQAFTKGEATELRERLAAEETAQPTQPEANQEQTVRPENYQGRHRKLGRIASWFARFGR